LPHIKFIFFTGHRLVPTAARRQTTTLKGRNMKSWASCTGTTLNEAPATRSKHWPNHNGDFSILVSLLSHLYCYYCYCIFN